MVGHNLMQAIARVNRVFKGKDGGRVVVYIGIAAELKNALKTYTDAKHLAIRVGPWISILGPIQSFLGSVPPAFRTVPAVKPRMDWRNKPMLVV